MSARNEGLGGTMTTLIASAEPAVQELLGLEPHIAVAAMLPIGKSNFSIRPCTVARGCWTPTRASSTVAVHGEGQNHPRSDGQRR